MFASSAAGRWNCNKSEKERWLEKKILETLAVWTGASSFKESHLDSGPRASKVANFCTKLVLEG